MAKGLGAIMAAVSAAETEYKVRRGEVILCPLCGEPMKFEGVAWFCRAGEPERNSDYNNPCNFSELQARFESPVLMDFQRSTLATVAVEDADAPGGYHVLAEFFPTRGQGGRTNLSVSAAFGVDASKIPELINAHGWTWAEWTGR